METRLEKKKNITNEFDYKYLFIEMNIYNILILKTKTK